MTERLGSTALAITLIDALEAYIGNKKPVVVDGNSLNIASIVAVARYNVIPTLSRDQDLQAKVAAAAEVVQQSISGGGSLYGVTTGVGASAFTRSRQVEVLQRAFVTKNLNGIIPSLSRLASGNLHERTHLLLKEDFMHGTVMVRLNTLLRGHSGVRWTVVESMFKLLEEGVVPCAPKNNTISASGDLGTLAYIAGTLLGLDDIHVWYGVGPDRSIRPASQVLKQINLTPLTYGPKEAIAIINGTAASASAAAQVLYDAFVMLLAAQAISVLTIEALRANLEPFEPFPHTHARPHPGQIEIAENIKRMATGSKFGFVEYPEGDPEFLLRQDRYHIRCLPQWLGPFAESLVEAAKQVTIELNSTTDNPIIDPNGTFPHNLYHAGNFMALSPAEAMDKVRHAMLGIGKVLYAQHTEILNPALNRGLPPDCAAGEPNLDYGFKSSDLACSAYLSELGFISGSFLPFVNSTEQHNQSINSMALASARYARESIDLTRQLIATHILTACQALDIREMNARFLTQLEELFSSSLGSVLSTSDAASWATIKSNLFRTIRVQFGLTTSMESSIRFQTMLTPLVPEIYALVHTSGVAKLVSGDETVTAWVGKLAEQARELFIRERLAYFTEGGSAYDSLSNSSKVIYGFVRRDLGIPMKKGLPGMDVHEIGTGHSEIFEAMVSGRMDSVFRAAVVAA